MEDRKRIFERSSPKRDKVVPQPKRFVAHFFSNVTADESGAHVGCIAVKNINSERSIRWQNPFSTFREMGRVSSRSEWCQLPAFTAASCAGSVVCVGPRVVIDGKAYYQESEVAKAMHRLGAAWISWSAATDEPAA